MTSTVQLDDNHVAKVPSEQLRHEKHLEKCVTPIFHINSEESLTRNRKILKVRRQGVPVSATFSKKRVSDGRNDCNVVIYYEQDLELAKARLRTYAAYTPTDRELQERAAEYRKRLRKYNRMYAPS